MEMFRDKHKTLNDVPITLFPFLQAFTTEGSSVVEENTTQMLPLETDLKFEDELLTINMGALLAEVRNDSVNFPENVLQEEAEKENEVNSQSCQGNSKNGV